MQCPSCGAPRAPGAAAACHGCGWLFDPDVTGATPVPVRNSGGVDETRLSGSIVPLDETRLTPRPRKAPASPAAPLEIGAGFGERYHIIKLLGMGGMGAVYQVWDAELEVAVALKVIRPDYTADPDAAAELERRFKRELLLARQVTHPNVVRIHDLGEVDGTKYLTMPYVHGKDLAAILDERGTLPIREALAIASQIANGLLAAHTAGVVHRDLKPANILIDADGHALITDFGIARGTSTPEAVAVTAPGITRRPSFHAGGMTQIGTVMGSVEYMAPEQARGEAVDHRADIYAFGLILYRMLAGRPPASPDGPLAVLQARMQAEPRRLREINTAVPEAVERLVSRCLQPDPAARFQTTQELVTALDRLDADGNPVPLPVQLLKSVRFWIAAITVAAAIVGTTLFIAGRPPPPTPDPVAILVADFSNRTGEKVFDGLLEQAVTVGVEGASFITAMPRAKAAETARLIKAGNHLDESAARLVALREGIKVVLLGGIEKRGSGYRLSIQGVDPSSRKVLFASTQDARDAGSVLRAGASLAAKVRASLGDTRAVDPRETLSTASLEAANAYTQAQQLSAAGKDQEAIESFRKAVALDAGFGRAYGGMAMSATRLGHREEAETLWKEALKHTDVMSEREKYRLLGAYYTLVTRNFAAALETYKKLVEQYPADGAGHNNLAVSYFRALRFTDALNEGRALRQIYPNSPLYRSNYALYAMYAGNFPVATQEAKKLVDEGLAAYDTYLPIAVGAIADNNLPAARDAYDRMAAAEDEGASLAALGRADLALAQGLAGDAVAILEAGIKADAAQKNQAAIAVKEIALADALGMQGDIKGAAAAARRALAFDKTEAQIVPAVRWLIAANQIDEAADLGRTLDSRLEAQARAYGRVVAAQLELARGRPIEAVDALRKGLTLADLWLVRFNLGQAYLAAGAPAEAFSEFEGCEKRRGEGYAAFLDDMPTARDVAPIPYWMGRAHEGMGLTAQALKEYQAFTAAYAAGSPEPLLRDAARRIQALR